MFEIRNIRIVQYEAETISYLGHKDNESPSRIGNLLPDKSIDSEN